LLASESPRRLSLLAQAGIVPDAVKPAAIDETPHKAESPRAHALRLARAKAMAVRETGMLVLAADTVVACGRRILPKAESDAEVRLCLEMLSGRRHMVITALALVDLASRTHTRVAMTRVSFTRLTQTDIQSYVDCREGLGKAGGYAIQGRAEMFVRQLNGSYSNVVGLPLFETMALLRGCGFSVP
jgi:septum formation protein